MSEKRVVVVGGGTGTSVVLTGLKERADLALSAIVVVSDNGGSTRRLRDEFGFLPVGDLRQCLAALANGSNQDEVRKLLLYRFDKGNGLQGHNLGNLILTALEDMSGSPGEAIEVASKIFRIKGTVLPVTEENVQLVIEYADGTVKIGEDTLDDPKQGGKQIIQIKLSPRAKLYHKAKDAILTAHHIILGPGDLYGSLLPNTLATGFPAALKKSSAQFIYIVNLMTHYSQTHNMTAMDHIRAVTNYCGRQPDVVIINSGTIPELMAQKYQANHEFLVRDDTHQHSLANMRIVRDDFVSKVVAHKVPGDALERSLLRHDVAKLTKTLLTLIQ